MLLLREDEDYLSQVRRKALNDETSQAKLTVCLVEYESLHKEMDWLRTSANQYQALALAIIAGLAPVVTFIFDRSPTSAVLVLLAASLGVVLLGFLYFRLHEEVYIVAAYINRVLRPRVGALIGGMQHWAWEDFKASSYLRLTRTHPGYLLARGNIGLALHSSVFLLPSLAAVLAAFVILIDQGMADTFRVVGPLGSFALIVLVILDGVLLTTLGYTLRKYGDLGSRLLGEASKP